MDVNYMGIIRITKGLLPSLRTYAKSRHTLSMGQKLPRARLISVTSIAGRLNSPGLGPYCASKHAAESILDTLRVELSPWEIDVSMIEPFFAKTPIMTNSSAAFEQNWKRAGEHVHAMYGQGFVEETLKRNQLLYEKAMPSQWVVQAAVNAVHKKNGAQTPRILVGFWYVSFLVWFFERAPAWMADGITRLGMKSQGSWPADPFLLKDGKRD
jgi:NAD(P)-dependent dehydrogenase (short-subunit alcohol dehydrogenase family)